MPFDFESAPLPGVIIVSHRVFGDHRGRFLETYKQSDFHAAGIGLSFVQDNHSVSERAVLRGLHWQAAPFAQGKLVRVVRGRVWDVAVDLRQASATHGQWFGTELSEANQRMLYIPPGFAHGFLTLSDDTHLLYRCTNEFAPEYERGCRYDDPQLGIAWPLAGIDPILSARDANLPRLEEIAD